MRYDFLNDARKLPGWAFLASDNVSMVASFLYQEFIKTRRSDIAHEELVIALANHLDYIKEETEDSYAMTAETYLTTWANKEWLRCYLDRDTLYYDLTPQIEPAINWIMSFTRQAHSNSIGTESKMMTLMNLMQEIVKNSSDDPEVRLYELQIRRDAIDKEMEDIREGRISVMSEQSQLDYFHDFIETSRALMADFRVVNDNFRKLDRKIRTDIATSDDAKGVVIKNILGEDADIEQSEQGKSFMMFSRLLRRTRAKQEFDRLVNGMMELPAISQSKESEMLHSLWSDLYVASGGVIRFKESINKQLAAQLSSKVRSENKRIKQIATEIAKLANQITDANPRANFETAFLDDCHPTLDIPVNRGLYVPPPKRVYQSDDIQEGEPHPTTDSLFALHSADRKRLVANVNNMLMVKPSVTLKEVLDRYPLRQGLLEMLTYLCYAHQDRGVTIDEDQLVDIIWGTPGYLKVGHVPNVTFTRPLKYEHH